MARTSNTLLIEGGDESGYHLFLILEEKLFSFSPLVKMLAVGFVICNFHYVGMLPLYSVW